MWKGPNTGYPKLEAMRPTDLIGWLRLWLLLLFRPRYRGAEYCDKHVCLFACLSVCLSARISRQLHGRTSSKFQCMLSGRWLVLLEGVAICRVIPASWMTSYSNVMGPICFIRRQLRNVFRTVLFYIMCISAVLNVIATKFAQKFCV